MNAKELRHYERFAREVIGPALLEAARVYPVKEPRRDLRRLTRRVSTGKILFGVFAHSAHPNFDGLAVISEEKPAVYFHPKPLMEIFRFDQELFLDRIVLVALHEFFHIRHHQLMHFDGKQLSGGVPLAQVQEDEIECWHYTAARLIKPMIEGDRLTREPENSLIRRAYAAYETADGEITSPAWRSFAQELTSANV